MVAALATVSMAQGFRGGRGMMGGNPAMLLSRADVQTELALTDEQKTKLSDIRDGMRDKFREAFQNAGDDAAARQKAMTDLMADVTKQINAILTADQQKRLKQISMQMSSYGILVNDTDLQTQLKLTDDQKAKIADMSKQQQAANAAIGEKIRNQEMTFQEAGPIFQKNQTALNDGIGKVLTDAQKAQFKDLSGKTFTETDPPPGGNR
jgi:Spy/CpxP family protein refolding chaperone